MKKSRVKKTTRAKALTKALTTVSEEQLKQLTLAQLRTLTKAKNILNRSKLKRKHEFVHALIGVVSLEDVQPYQSEKERVEGLPPSPVIPQPQEIALDPNAYLKDAYLFQEGRRLDGVVIGIDVHEESLTYCIIDSQQILKRGEYPNTEVGITELVKLGQQYSVQAIGMESTADYWRKAYWCLTNAHFAVLVANATQTKNTQGQKTDPKDAHRIALALRDGRLKPSLCCTEQQFLIRKLCRAAIKAIEKSTTFANQLRAYEQLADAPKWIKNLTKSQYGRELISTLSPDTTQAEIKSALQAAHSTWEEDELNTKSQDVYRYYQQLARKGLWPLYMNRLSQYLLNRREGKHLINMALQDAAPMPGFLMGVELMLTTSCIGLESAIHIMAEIVDISRFKTPEALVRWSGLNPVVNQSGRYKNKTGPISKKGNRYLRKILYVCAQNDYIHRNHPGHPLGEWMGRLKEVHNKCYKKALTAGARKLLTWIWGMLSSQTSFKVQATEETLSHLRDAAVKKMALLQNRLKNLQSVVVTGIKETVAVIQQEDPVELSQTFAKVLTETIQKYPELQLERKVLPVSSLIGLSNVLWQIEET